MTVAMRWCWWWRIMEIFWSCCLTVGICLTLPADASNVWQYKVKVSIFRKFQYLFLHSPSSASNSSPPPSNRSSFLECAVMMRIERVNKKLGIYYDSFVPSSKYRKKCEKYSALEKKNWKLKFLVSIFLLFWKMRLQYHYEIFWGV